MRILLLPGVLLLLLTACTTEQEVTACTNPPAQIEPEILLQEAHCPFNMSFTSENYIKQDYFTIKPILSSLDANICDEALLIERSQATNGLCKIQHAEILRSTGREEGKDTWQWRIDCVCSYE